jgi:hypothetical protein
MSELYSRNDIIQCPMIFQPNLTTPHPFSTELLHSLSISAALSIDFETSHNLSGTVSGSSPLLLYSRLQ